MSYDKLHYHIRGDKSKWVVTAICFLLIGVILCSILTSGFKDFNPYCWFGHEYDENGACVKCGALKPVEDEEIEDNNDQLAFAIANGHGLTLKRVSNKTDIESSETGSITITAIVSSDATDKSVTWSIAWKNAESDWATGKNIVDYITLTPDDSNNSVKVDCLRAFGEQAILTCKANGAVDLQATATVDFLKRIVGVNLSCDAVKLLDAAQETTSISVDGEQATRFTASILYGVGTVERTDVSEFYISGLDLELSDAIQAGIASDVANAQSQGAIEYKTKVSYPGNSNPFGNGQTLASIKIGFANFFTVKGGNTLHEYAARGRVYKNVATEGWFITATAQVKIKLSGGDVQSYNVSINVPISNSYLTDYTVPSNINLSTDKITF